MTGENANPVASDSWAPSKAAWRPDALRFHKYTAPSSFAAPSSDFLKGENASAVTPCEPGAARRETRLPETSEWTRMVPAASPDTTCLSDGENRSAVTASACPS